MERMSNNFMHLLTLSLFLFTTIVHTSWSVNGQIWQNPDGVSHIVNPASSSYYGLSKQIDLRISDIIAENVLHFGHNLGLELATLDPNAEKSEIFSPLSIMTALSLLALGAKGKSYQELKQLLALDSDSELIQRPDIYHREFGLMLNDLENSNLNNEGVNKRPNANWRFTKLIRETTRLTGRKRPVIDHIIRVANGIFIQSGYTLNLDYRQVIESIYKSKLIQLDFQNHNREARNYINGWVDRATFGKIPQIINGDIDRSTDVIIASVLYFKAFWETQFFPKGTNEDYFYPDGKHSPPIKVQMMPAGGVFPFYNAKEYDCRIIGLPYQGNETTMYVIQPNNSTRQKLRELQQILNARKINDMIDKMERKTTVMLFPKMHFTSSLNLKNILRKMNINDIFINGLSDLSLIGGRPVTSFASSNKKTVLFETINRQAPIHQRPHVFDRFDEPALVFASRFGEIEDLNTTTNGIEEPTTTTAKTSLNTNEAKSLNNREKRELPDLYSDEVQAAISNLETERSKVDSQRGSHFVDEIIHKVDFSVDEQGTEAAATTITSLNRSGTDVVFRADTPFLIVLRHDPTKLPLFYGIINKPELS